MRRDHQCFCHGRRDGGSRAVEPAWSGAGRPQDLFRIVRSSGPCPELFHLVRMDVISTAKEATVSGSPDVRSVLVGYDESPASEQALRWGVEEAQLRDLPLTVCHVWHWPYPFRPPEADTLRTLRDMAAVVADDGVRKAHALAEGLDIRWRLEQGFPPAMLLMASRDAGLVVLGSRGLGGFGNLTVGS